MGYNPYGNYPPNNYQQPYMNQQPYGSPMGSAATIFMCEQNTGLGGQSQMIPLNGPVNLQPVVQQVQMYLMGQGFQVYPFAGQNMAVIQAQHNSVLGMLTDKNVSYTVRICESNMGGQWMAVVETGIANLMQDLMGLATAAGGTYFIGDDLLHSKLLEILGGGFTAYDAYNFYKSYANEDQLLNMISMALYSAPPMTQQVPPYGQPNMPPQSQYPPGQPGAYTSQPVSRPEPTPQPQPVTQPQVARPEASQSNSQSTQLPQSRNEIKCPSCGAEVDANSKFCPNCGSSLTESNKAKEHYDESSTEHHDEDYYPHHESHREYNEEHPIHEDEYERHHKERNVRREDEYSHRHYDESHREHHREHNNPVSEKSHEEYTKDHEEHKGKGEHKKHHTHYEESNEEE